MASRVRRLATDVVRLNPRVLESVKYLARLTGLSPSDIIEAVLMEVLQDDVVSSISPLPGPPSVMRSPAKIIPIDRAAAKHGPRPVDLAGLRRQAFETRQHAHEVRERAVAACRAAERARVHASEALEAFGPRR